MLESKNFRTLIAIASVCLPPALFLAACGDDETTETYIPPGTTTTATTTTTTTGPGICLLNNCDNDEQCAGCADGRNTCLENEGRCVACDPNNPSVGCPPGQMCSPYGLCVPEGLTCPMDENDVPNFNCGANSDCLACSPANQVCDGNPPRCVECSATNTQHCSQNEYCLEGKCAPKCPTTCTVNNDCMNCGNAGNEAHACFQHKCAQCNEDTFPCPAGMQCDNGKCIPPCGIPGDVAGDCVHDEDCHWCGGEEAAGTFVCDKPLNAEETDHGTCVPPANGCSDLGQGVAVLPDPWNDYTELCSNEADCEPIDVDYNVGKLIRDLIGSDELNIGIGTLTICDVNFSYPMPECAEIKITDGVQCGICVPCKADGDCATIPVDPFIMGLFCEDPLAAIAGAFLIDLLWGDAPQNNLNFFCQPIAAGYGVCIPCGNPTAPCGGGGGSTGDCDHDVCEEGDALGTNCGECAAAVCAADGYCCDTANDPGAWDATCVDEVNQYCTTGCGGGSTCAHSPCEEGDKLAAACSACTTAVCADDPFCCNSQWDAVCVSSAEANTTCQAECGGTACAHSECDAGSKLTSGCSDCATAVCALDSECCDDTYGWDDICVGYAEDDDVNCDCP